MNTEVVKGKVQLKAFMNNKSTGQHRRNKKLKIIKNKDL